MIRWVTPAVLGLLLHRHDLTTRKLFCQCTVKLFTRHALYLRYHLALRLRWGCRSSTLSAQNTKPRTRALYACQSRARPQNYGKHPAEGGWRAVLLLFALMPAAMPHPSAFTLGRARQCPVLDQDVSSVSLRAGLFRAGTQQSPALSQAAVQPADLPAAVPRRQWQQRRGQLWRQVARLCAARQTLRARRSGCRRCTR